MATFLNASAIIGPWSSIVPSQTSGSSTWDGVFSIRYVQEWSINTFDFLQTFWSVCTKVLSPSFARFLNVNSRPYSRYRLAAEYATSHYEASLTWHPEQDETPWICFHIRSAQSIRYSVCWMSSMFWIAMADPSLPVTPAITPRQGNRAIGKRIVVVPGLSKCGLKMKETSGLWQRLFVLIHHQTRVSSDNHKEWDEWTGLCRTPGPA